MWRTTKWDAAEHEGSSIVGKVLFSRIALFADKLNGFEVPELWLVSLTAGKEERIMGEMGSRQRVSTCVSERAETGRFLSCHVARRLMQVVRNIGKCLKILGWNSYLTR